MEELCSACLCTGRNLIFIGDTDVSEIYSQILNEIPMAAPRVCWQCRALLRRLLRFQSQVKRSNCLLRDVHQSSVMELARPPRLCVQRVSQISLPYDDLAPKAEPGQDEPGPEPPEVKSEPEELPEHRELTFANALHHPHTSPTKEKTKSKLKDKKTDKKTAKKKVRKRKRKKSVSTDSIDNDDVGIDCNGGIDCDTRSADGGEIEKVEEEERVGREMEKMEEEERIGGEMEKMEEERVGGEMEKMEEERVNGEEKDLAPEDDAVAQAGPRPQCAECGKQFSSRKTYRYHLNVVHKGQNRHPCPRCGKVYQWKSNLGRHLRSHKARDLGELHCAPCDRWFASVATYRQHLRGSRRHVPETEFSFMCTECGKKFVNKTRLRDHVDWEHLHNIKFRCQLCNKPFKCHTSLYVHTQNVHRDREKKDNLCHVCGKSYQNAAKLKYHIVAMHTHETPYRCSQCGAAFGWYSSLYRHLREVHHKMKVQPKKAKRAKRDATLLA